MIIRTVSPVDKGPDQCIGNSPSEEIDGETENGDIAIEKGILVDFEDILIEEDVEGCGGYGG